MKIIDTHQHLWDQNLFSYSWCRSISKLNRSFRIKDYIAAAEGTGICRTVHLEADVDEPDMLGETEYILSLAGASSNPLEGVVAPCRPEKKGFREYLERIAPHPNLKGLRRVLHTEADGLAENPLFIENVKSLSEYDLSFDICVLSHQLPQAINLVRRCPNTSFILDHCGNPLIKERVMEPWRELIGEMAALPNVVCKISGLLTQAEPDNWSPEDLRPYVNQIIESFGWERVIFGSDWPVCTLAASLKQWVEALLLLTRDAGEENQQKLFYENARRVYRLA